MPQTTLVRGESLAESIDSAKELARAAGRRNSIPIRKAFVEAAEPGAMSPLVQLYRGGRSGVVAVKLYLGLVWRCAGRDALGTYSTSAPARNWAVLLGLPDPDTKGARRIAAATQKLERRRLITVQDRPGHANKITLMDEAGTGRQYELPSTAYATAKQETDRARHRYFKVADELWTGGHIQQLHGPGLVTLLLLLSDQGYRGLSVWFSETRLQELGVSDDTRRRGISELETAGLVNVHREPVTEKGGMWGQKRFRNVYRLLEPAVIKEKS